MTTCAARPGAMSSEELAALVDAAVDSSDRMLFTITPREELDEAARWQRLQDEAWAGQARSIIASVNRAGPGWREFVADELALAINTSPTTASRLVGDALAVGALPGLLEAVSAGMLTSRHALAVVRELDKVELDLEQRISIVLVALARYRGQTPGELAKLIARLILQVDLDAAKARQDKASAERYVTTYRDTDGQAVIHARGPIAQAAAVQAALDAWLRDNPRQPDDTRPEAQRRYDAFISLITGGTSHAHWQAAIVVPFTTAAGGELELAEVPGLGPVLPSTAHEVLGQAGSLTQVSVDERGDVIAVGDPVPAPAPGAAPAPAPRPVLYDEQAQAIRLLMSQPPPERLHPQNLASAAYKTPGRLRRYLIARDRTCVFPGCHQRITDVDHRIPWPLGPTAAWNLQLLCRRHHRAKQAVFTVTLTPDGDYLWITRGGWAFLRPRHRIGQGY